MHGCEAEDTITPLDERDYDGLLRLADQKITQLFRGEPKPDLYTIFAFCNAIRKDPDTEKYTLTKFNSYFLARTLTLLITRHFLLRRYYIYISPRNDFGSLSEPEINAIVDEEMNNTSVPDPWIKSTIRFESKVRMILLKF